MTTPRVPRPRLPGDEGVSLSELPAIAAGILGLAGSIQPPPYGPEAAALARTSLYSAAEWQAALDLIAGHEYRDAILHVLTSGAIHGYDPVSAAALILDVMTPPGALHIARLRVSRWRRLAAWLAGPVTQWRGRRQLRGWTTIGATDDGDP
jgi:hypothetical protein